MKYFSKMELGVALALALTACGSGDDKGAKERDEPVQTGTPDLRALPLEKAPPIVFVHGFAGSAQQYDSQAIRFAANGYPRERIFALDHDGAGVDYAGYVSQVDGLVDDVLAQFDVDKVILVGHSRGTLVSSNYLGEPARAAKIAKYISLDGGGCGVADTAGVPCLAPSQAILTGQSHVEVATSAESFAMQYEFIVGEAPEVTEIVRQDKPVELSGRVVNFPANTGRDGATLDVWEIDSSTGHRVASKPMKTFSIDETGDWGPIVVSPEAHYEWAVSAPNSGTQRFYLQKYLRSSHLVRLLSGPPDSPIRKATNRSPDHAAVLAMRMREWYADPGAQRDPAKMDVLEIESPGADPVDILAPRMTNADIAIHIHDDAATPGESTFGPLAPFLDPSCTNCSAFQTTADVFMAASDPPNKTITLRNIPRGDTERPQVINVPNWPSSDSLITVVFSDYPQ
jgi:pimeloyl-ACP methyl ester carboxylesterase